MNQSATSPLKTENRFPDCVSMKLHSAPAQLKEPPLVLLSTISPASAATGQIDLKLTLRFDKQEIKVPGGQVWIGLKGGELRLKLQNGRIPLERMGLTNPFETAVEVEQQQETGKEAEANLAVAGGIKTKDASKTSTKTKYKTYQVSNRGTEEEPVWAFEVKTGVEPILTGRITEEPLGTIEVNGATCSVEVTFAVRDQRDIHLFDSKGLLAARNLSRNKTAWATREFFLRFVAPKLQPHLSRIEGQL